MRTNSIRCWFPLFLLGLANSVLSSPTAPDAGGFTDSQAAARRKPYHPPVRKGDPPTWTKPYHGTPSRKCRAKPAAEVIQALLKKHHNIDVALEKLGNSVDVMDVSPDDSEYVKAQEASASLRDAPQPEPVFKRPEHRLFATWFAECPTIGKMVKAFMWGARYMAENNSMLWERIYHIDEFLVETFQPTTGDMHALWKHEWCVPVDQKECWYMALGFTNGKLDSAHKTVDMDFVRDGPDPKVNSKLYEFCSAIGSPPSESGTSCLTDTIIVMTPKSPPHYRSRLSRETNT